MTAPEPEATVTWSLSLGGGLALHRDLCLPVCVPLPALGTDPLPRPLPACSKGVQPQRLRPLEDSRQSKAKEIPALPRLLLDTAVPTGKKRRNADGGHLPHHPRLPLLVTELVLPWAWKDGEGSPDWLRRPLLKPWQTIGLGEKKGPASADSPGPHLMS